MEAILVKNKSITRRLKKLCRIRNHKHELAQAAAGIPKKKRTTVKRFTVNEEVLKLGIAHPSIQEELTNGNAKQV